MNIDDKFILQFSDNTKLDYYKQTVKNYCRIYIIYYDYLK